MVRMTLYRGRKSLTDFENEPHNTRRNTVTHKTIDKFGKGLCLINPLSVVRRKGRDRSFEIKLPVCVPPRTIYRQSLLYN